MKIAVEMTFGDSPIISLLVGEIDMKEYKNILQNVHLQTYQEQLKSMLKTIREVPELNLNPHQFSRLKKKILEEL